jgi:hypothetical protein
VRFVEIWRETHAGPANADAIDAHLHDERVERGSRAQRHHAASISGLPDGTFVLRDDEPFLVLGSSLLRWTNAGYAERVPRPVKERGTVITPPSLVSVLRTGRDPVVPFFHPTSGRVGSA